MAKKTRAAHFLLAGNFEVPKNCKPFRAVPGGPVTGFVMKDGRIAVPQVTLEILDPKTEEYTEPGTCELEDMGINDFGELSQRDLYLD